MFVDASVIVALIAYEDGAQDFADRIDREDVCITSPLSIWEAVVALARNLNLPPARAAFRVEQLCSLSGIDVRPVPPEATALAIGAWERFGKGRHPAALNFGDCFSYACARHYGLPLLYKGGDFALTDIAAA